MAKVSLKIPDPQPKQKLFLKAKKKHVGFGGARGGGKSWVVRVKAILLSLQYAGIAILIVRRTYPELESNHGKPLKKMLMPLHKKRMKYSKRRMI